MTHPSSPGGTTAGNGRVRVMHIAPEMAIGGLPEVIATLCRTVDPDRFDLSLLCINAVGAIGEELGHSGIPVHLVGRRNGRPNYLAFRDVARIVRRHRVDVVHTHNTQAFIDGVLGARLAGVRTIVHTDHAREFPDKLRYRIAEHVASRMVYRVVGVSEHTTAELIRNVRIPRRRLVTIPNGINGERYRVSIDPAAKRRALGMRSAGPVIGLAARLEDQKGIRYLLDAMPAVRAAFPDVTLLIAGEGPREADLRSQSAGLGLGEHVRFLGARRDVPELLQLLDLFLLPSIWEGLPMSILEALAAGCPIVASAVGGVPSAITDGVNGTLVPPRDPEKLARAIIELLGNESRRRQFARCGHDRFEANYSARAMARAYEKLYTRT